MTWCAPLGTFPGMKFETGPLTLRAWRDWRKRQTPPEWQVARSVSKETYLPGLGGFKTSRFLHITPLNLNSLYSGLNGVQSHVPSIWPQQHIALSRLRPWNGSHCEHRGQHVHSKDPLIALAQVKGQRPLNDLLQYLSRIFAELSFQILDHYFLNVLCAVDNVMAWHISGLIYNVRTNILYCFLKSRQSTK